MTQLKWDDETSYSRNDTRVEARIVSAIVPVAKCRAITVTVHRIHHHDGEWFVTCHPLSIKDAKLEATELEDAKREAIERLQTKTNRIATAFANVDP